MTTVPSKGDTGNMAKFDQVHTLRVADSNLSELVPQPHDDAKDDNRLLSAIREQPLTFGWSIYTILVMVTSAYTNSISNSVLGIPQFRKDFGYQFGGNYVLPA